MHGLNDDGDWGPFTAVFVNITSPPPPDTLIASGSPLSIPIVYGEAAITATLTSGGSPAPGWIVTFTTDLGTVNPPTAYSDENGQAVTTLYAGDTTGTAHVTATAATLSDGVDIAIYTPDAPSAGFISNSPVCSGTVAVFTNTTTSPPEVPVTYLWDFGDGITSTETSPLHTYAAGTYTVTLEASNVGGSDTATSTLTVLATPQASFTFTPAFPAPGELVHFYDNSSNSPDGWNWDLGDGTYAQVQNPVHTYAAGTYTVTLRARNGCGWGSTTSRIITVGQPPQATIYLPMMVREFP